VADRAILVRKITTFLFLTFAFSAVFYWLIISAGSLKANGNPYVHGLMWCPGAAALLTQLIYQHNISGLGWRWGGMNYMVLSYSIPLLYALTAYGIVWTTGLGGFPNASFVERVVNRFGGTPASAVSAYVALSATLGVLGGCLSALGEEIGWRGFLVPHLAMLMSFPKLALLSGAIWSVWHYPILVFGGYNAGSPIWYALPCFTVMVIGISVVFAWMRLKSGSVWTGMLLHASHNLFVQQVLTPFTADTGHTRYFIDEFGVFLPLTAAITAVIFWKLPRPPSPVPSTQPSLRSLLSRHIHHGRAAP
jgi:membrane protease YdiL (CAAX protease family)